MSLCLLGARFLLFENFEGVSTAYRVGKDLLLFWE